MKVKIEIDLQPFSVPNFVLTVPKRGRHEDELPKYALADLDSDTLFDLCAEFVSDIYKKADKRQPASIVI